MTDTPAFNPTALATMTEEQLRVVDVPWPNTEEDMLATVRALIDRQHDYGTCVYAMSIAAVTVFRLVARKLGVTGFQASCADMDVLRRIRNWRAGFQVVNYENLLYPQYDDKLRISPESLLRDDNVREWAAKEAKKLLATKMDAHADVLAHWRKLAAMEAAS